MYKPEFYKLVADYADVPIDKAEKFVKAFEEEIMMIFATEDKIDLKFGRFWGETKKSYRYYNNNIKEYCMTKEKPRYPHFKANSKAKE